MRIRLTLWVVAIYAIIHWTIGGVLWLYQSRSIDRVFDQRLLERAEEMAGPVAQMVPGIDRAGLSEMAEDYTRHYELELFAIDVLREDGTPAIPGGEPLFDPGVVPVAAVLASDRPRSLRLPMWSESESSEQERGGEGVVSEGAANAPSPSGPGPVELRGSSARVMAMVILGADLEPYVLLVASNDYVARTQMVLIRRLFLVSAVLGPLMAGLSGWFIAGIAVAPFARLRRMASQFGPESLDTELDMPAQNKEVAMLRDQLDEARQRIREAFHSQERFLANVSHELKMPIAVILTEAQTLNLEDASPEVEEFVVSAREEMQRLGKLVESFLTLARVRDGEGKARGKLYAANDLAMDSVENCAVMAQQRQVRLSAELLDDDESLHASVSGDPELLRTMLDNLVHNAIRFTPPGKRVTVRVSLEDERVVISVIDEGPGIPCDEIGTVFDRYKQGGNQPSGGGRGDGLGLAIAQGIAELHGGRIAAQNSEGGGCDFTARLPRADTTASN